MLQVKKKITLVGLVWPSHWRLQNNGYTKGDSGYEMGTGKRDITFHTADDQKFEVTFRRIWPND